MYTRFDKALVAAIMAAIGLANYAGLIPGAPDQHTVALIVEWATPALVAAIPNLPKDPATAA